MSQSHQGQDLSWILNASLTSEFRVNGSIAGTIPSSEGSEIHSRDFEATATPFIREESQKIGDKSALVHATSAPKTPIPIATVPFHTAIFDPNNDYDITIPTPLPKPPTLSTLPPEVHLVLFDHLDPAASTLLELTCKKFYKIHRATHGTVSLSTSSTEISNIPNHLVFPYDSLDIYPSSPTISNPCLGTILQSWLPKSLRY